MVGVTPKKAAKTTGSVVTPSPPKGTVCVPAKSTAKRPSHRCGKYGCNHNNVNSPNLKFHSVVSYPAEIKSKNPSRAQVINREGKILLRQETMDRIGESRYCKTKKYVCEDHLFETVVKSRLVSYNGSKFVQRYKLTVPCGAGSESSLSQSNTASKGMGCDRGLRVILEQASQQEVDSSLHSQSEEMDAMLVQLESANTAY